MPDFQSDIQHIKKHGFFPEKAELKALTWKQPFAELMLHGKIETRTWNTKYRGWVLICAAKKPYSLAEEKTICGNENFERIAQIPNMELKNGFAIAVAMLFKTRPMTAEDEKRCYVKYKPGLWCHLYTQVMPITPLPWKGSLGWRNVSVDDKQKIIF